MEMAPRTVKSRSGNSLRAISDAEYTDAPDSDTETTMISVRPSFFKVERTNASVSRPAVPLPTAIACGAYFCTIIAIARSASAGCCIG